MSEIDNFRVYMKPLVECVVHDATINHNNILTHEEEHETTDFSKFVGRLVMGYEGKYPG